MELELSEIQEEEGSEEVMEEEEVEVNYYYDQQEDDTFISQQNSVSSSSAEDGGGGGSGLSSSRQRRRLERKRYHEIQLEQRVAGAIEAAAAANAADEDSSVIDEVDLSLEDQDQASVSKSNDAVHNRGQGQGDVRNDNDEGKKHPSLPIPKGAPVPVRRTEQKIKSNESEGNSQNRRMLANFPVETAVADDMNDIEEIIKKLEKLEKAHALLENVLSPSETDGESESQGSESPFSQSVSVSISKSQLLDSSRPMTGGLDSSRIEDEHGNPFKEWEKIRDEIMRQDLLTDDLTPGLSQTQSSVKRLPQEVPTTMRPISAEEETEDILRQLENLEKAQLFSETGVGKDTLYSTAKPSHPNPYRISTRPSLPQQVRVFKKPPTPVSIKTKSTSSRSYQKAQDSKHSSEGKPVKEIKEKTFEKHLKFVGTQTQSSTAADQENLNESITKKDSHTQSSSSFIIKSPAPTTNVQTQCSDETSTKMEKLESLLDTFRKENEKLHKQLEETQDNFTAKEEKYTKEMNNLQTEIAKIKLQRLLPPTTPISSPRFGPQQKNEIERLRAELDAKSDLTMELRREIARLKVEVSKPKTVVVPDKAAIEDLTSKLTKSHAETAHLKSELTKSKRELEKASRSSSQGSVTGASVATAKQDANTLSLAIKSFKSELADKDKELIKLKKELSESKKLNTQLKNEKLKLMSNTVNKTFGSGNSKQSPTLNRAKSDLTRPVRNSTAPAGPRRRSDAPEKPNSAPAPSSNPSDLEMIHATLQQERAEFEEEMEKKKRLINEKDKIIRELKTRLEMLELALHDAQSNSGDNGVLLQQLRSRLQTQNKVIENLKEHLASYGGVENEMASMRKEKSLLEFRIRELTQQLSLAKTLNKPESDILADLNEKVEALSSRYCYREKQLDTLLARLSSKHNGASPRRILPTEPLLDLGSNDNLLMDPEFETGNNVRNKGDSIDLSNFSPTTMQILAGADRKF